MLPKFEPKTFIHALEKYQPSFLHLAPPLLAFCADHPGVRPEALTKLHHIMTAAAPTGPALIRRFKEKAPDVIIKEGWGMSETSPLGLLSPLDQIVEGSCGVVVPNTELKIVDLTTGENLPAHQSGELCVRGPQIMPGYLDNEKATKETIKNGWLHSGDIAHYDEKGNIFISDRLKELIKVKGFQVIPTQSILKYVLKIRVFRFLQLNWKIYFVLFLELPMLPSLELITKGLAKPQELML